MIIDNNKIKLWSSIGSRASFGLAAFELAKNNNNLMIVTADVSTSAGLDRYKKKYPNNYVDVGIGEQNMMSVASGLASEGFDVITTTFSPFQTLRCAEQIKVNLGYMKNKVVMVGLASGLILGNLGFTHCSIEDIGILRSIPNLTIISPADSFETVKATEASVKHDQSVYIRLTGGSNNPMVYESDYKFEIGKAKMLIDNGEILIISNGMMVKKSIDIANYFKERGVNISVINMHTIKPLDHDLLDKIISKYKYCFSIEEHNIFGGLGSALSEYFASKDHKIKFKSIGIEDKYIKSGSYNYLLKEYRLDNESIINTIKKIISHE
jgi:transketolase